ncbi:YlzJ-like family protein [Paenibacillus durus]|uniref:YlzJ-like protein n=1 Tax=Paenibacillus durus ATCC 35681 TaxID=1333534 RepID=A0A0F7CJ19_PAEDU|nr:YlzJ-like family protein [Paenibacillus durus]AKG35160.1 hypothetical protein VK70_11760 [Paenibacillus durus ATCC 35681]
MILYSVISADQVWEGAIKASPPFREVTVQGIVMQVEPLDEGRARIVRLLQCPLHRYLEPGLAPGQIISYSSGGSGGF